MSNKSNQLPLSTEMFHKSHKTRYSDSSAYDTICVKCGATDSRGETKYQQRCLKEHSEEEPWSGKIVKYWKDV